MKIVFMGTPDFSVPILEALVDAGHDVVAAYSQPPRPAGRGKKDRPSPVQKKAETLGIPVHVPTSLKTSETQADFAALDADVAVVVAYGLILPQAILDAPRNGCLNIHASLLPRWRGAAPIHRAIMAGDQKTGICIMQMDAGLDTGDVLLRKETYIGATETTGALHDRLSQMGADLITHTLSVLDSLTPTPQPAQGITYAEKIDKAEARINWSQDAQSIAHHINGLSPFPGAWSDAQGERLKLLQAEPVGDTLAVGQVKTDGSDIIIGTNAGAVRILKLQRPGKKPMATADALHGWTLPEYLS